MPARRSVAATSGNTARHGGMLDTDAPSRRAGGDRGPRLVAAPRPPSGGARQPLAVVSRRRRVRRREPPWRSATQTHTVRHGRLERPGREDKERAIVERAAARFEAALTTLNEGRRAPAPTSASTGRQRSGRRRIPASLKHYQEVTARPDRRGGRRRHLDPSPPGRSMATPDPGVYCLRAARPTRRRLVAHRHHPHRRRAVFRAKSELDAPHLPPQAQRADGHLFEQRLPARARSPHPAGAHGEHASWTPRADPRTAARHRHLPAPRRAHPARAHRHAGRSRTAGHLRRARRRPATEASARQRSTDPFPGLRRFVVPLERFCAVSC